MNTADLDPFGPDSYPDVVQASAERRDLFRAVAKTILQRRHVDPYTRQWAEAWADVQACADGS